jgi:tetratricopeptide (TPR) repeat protein
MVHILKHLVVVFIFYLVGEGYVTGQVDQILKPVEIHPPLPTQQKSKQESDEQLAAQFFQKQDYEKAVILYENLFKKNNNSINYNYYLYCLMELKMFRDAEKLVKGMVKDNPDNPSYGVDLGYVYTEEGEINKANKQFEGMLKDIKPSRTYIIELANAFLIRNQPGFSAEVYQKGNLLMKDNPFYLELGDLFNQTGNYSMMVEEYLDYLEFDKINEGVIQNKFQNSLSDNQDKGINELLRKSLLKRIQKNPDETINIEMLLWLSVQEKDFELAFKQAKSLDRRLNENGDRIFDLAGLCLSNKSYDVAIEAYNYILKKGKGNYLYIDAKIGLLTARYLKITDTYNPVHEDLILLEKDYQSTLDEYGENASTIGVMKYLAHIQGFYLNKFDDAITLLTWAVDIPSAAPSAIAECKIELGDIYLFTNNVWEALLLYSQVDKAFKNDPIGHLAKFKNAKLSYYIGEFGWAKAQLDVLKAATSKLIANDALKLSVLISDNIDFDSSTVALSMYARADLLEYRNQDDLAIQTLDSVFGLAKWHPIFDEVLLKKAEIMMKHGEFIKASGFLEEIVNDYPLDITADNALFLLADINENQFHDIKKAKLLYEKLMTNYPASLFVIEARKRFRTLRGDFNNSGT